MLLFCLRERLSLMSSCLARGPNVPYAASALRQARSEALEDVTVPIMRFESIRTTDGPSKHIEMFIYV